MARPKTKTENQDRIILAFLKRVTQRVEKESGIKGWECLVDDDLIDDEDVGVYIIGNESLDPSLILEVNVKPKKILVFIYNDNSAFLESMLESLKEELPKVAKRLKIRINDWTIFW